ncbi:MAG TPA: SRPBCC family protein [Terracidiphilus sp.]|nr:SRPBCC family protein [Terracidiphilus sp.]
MKISVNQITRRRAMGAAAAAVAFPAGGWRAPAQQPAMEEKPTTGPNATRTSLHQEIALDAPPERVFNLLMDSKLFAAFTGMPATIDPKAGGAFTTFGGLVEGRNVELIPNQRIVQAWRPTSWDPGVYSIVHFELKTANAGTMLALDHTGFPEGDFDHLDPGWHLRYWDPLKKYLATPQ